VKALYKGASLIAKMNDKLGPDFKLARSVRQGCPLASYLFILATNVLGYMLANPKNEVEGLSLPRGGLIRDQTFINALYLKGTFLEPGQGAQSTYDLQRSLRCESKLAQVRGHLGQQEGEDLAMGNRNRPQKDAGRTRHKVPRSSGRLPSPPRGEFR